MRFAMPDDVITVPTVEALEHLEGRLSGRSSTPRWRSQSQRDYDRILYSSAFQRLGAITQVTASEVGRPFHTRLTHTLKVAQVARRSAERLKAMLKDGELDGSAAALVAALNVDATEAAALGHDIGHPPFGHLAETVLNKAAHDAGGFEGNAQSFRVLTRLALRAPYEGLDLSLDPPMGLRLGLFRVAGGCLRCWGVGAGRGSVRWGNEAPRPVVIGWFAGGGDRRRLWRCSSGSSAGVSCVRRRRGALVAW
jgi:hypothetical protein